MEKIFKAKRIDNGEWFEFDFIDIAGTYPNGSIYVCDCMNEVTYELDYSTLCQYTGINDIEGNRIFEGDEVCVEGVGDVIVSADVNGVHCGDEPYICCYGDIDHLTGHNIHDRG